MPLIGTLGMFIIDTFSLYDEENPDAEPSDRGLGKQIGGGGTYFQVGARVFSQPHQLLMVIDRGSDFPKEAQEALDRFSKADRSQESTADEGQTMWRFRDRGDGMQTTMAVNVYRGEHRGFEYLTPKQRLEPPDLLTVDPDSLESFLPAFIHCICSPERAMQICDQIDKIDSERPQKTKIVWEPIPDSCKPENLETCIQVMERIDLFSPNHEEAASFLSVTDALSNKEENTSSRKDRLTTLLASNFSKRCKIPIVCIRCGALGSVIGREDLGWKWVDAWYSKDMQEEVVDVTGAGNGFLGGLTSYLSQVNGSQESTASNVKAEWSLDQLEEAAIHGSVSASFIVEQLGLPSISESSDGQTLWNGELPQSRVESLRSRLKASR